MLHYSCDHGHLDVVQMLIVMGGTEHLNVADSEGLTVSSMGVLCTQTALNATEIRFTNDKRCGSRG